MEIFSNSQLHKNERKGEGGRKEERKMGAREGGKVEGRMKKGGRGEEGIMEGKEKRRKEGGNDG